MVNRARRYASSFIVLRAAPDRHQTSSWILSMLAMPGDG
jgi:hypothetical protein